MFAAASAFAFVEIIDAAATAAMAAARAGRDELRRVMDTAEAGLPFVVAAASPGASTALPGTSAVSSVAETLVCGFIALSSWSVEKALPT